MGRIMMMLCAAMALSACCGTRSECCRVNESATETGNCIKPYGCSCTSTYSASCACSGGEKVTY